MNHDDPVIDRLESTLDRFVAAVGDAAPAVIMRVDRPSHGLAWSAARGARRLGGEPALASDGFRIASVAKTLTAATVLDLVAAGRISLDAPITDHLGEPMRTLLDVIPSSTRTQITIGSLMQHMSGIHDFGTEPEYFARIQADPTHGGPPKNSSSCRCDVAR